MKKIISISAIFIVIEVIAGIIMYSYLPDQIPVHWGISGEVDGYGGRFMIFLAPVVSIIFTALLAFLPKIDPKGANIVRSGKIYPVVIIGLNLLFLILFTVTALTCFGIKIAVNIVIPLTIGIFFVILGNYMPKMKFNYFCGIRTPWALANEVVWAKTQRIGGWCFVASGLLFVVSVFFPAPYNFVIPIIGLLAIIIITTLYSYLVYKKTVN